MPVHLGAHLRAEHILGSAPDDLVPRHPEEAKGRRVDLLVAESAVVLDQDRVALGGMLEKGADQRLCGRQLRRPLLDSPLQRLVDLRQFRLSPFCVSNVMANADEADMFPCRPESRLGLRSHPPPRPVAAKKASFDRDNPHGGSDDWLFLKNSSEIIRVKRSSPIECEGLGIGKSHEIEIGLIDEFSLAVGAGHPDQHRRAVGDGAEPLLAFGDLPLGKLSIRDVGDDDIDAENAARRIAMRNMNDLRRGDAGRADEIRLVRDVLAGKRALQIWPPRLVHLRAHHFVHPPAENGAQGTFEPRFVGLVGEAENLILVDVGDEHRKRVGDRAQFLFAFQRFLLGELAVGDVEMRADQGDRRRAFVAFDFSDGADPAHRAVARADDAVFRLVLGRAAGDDAEKVINRTRPVLGMNSPRPIVEGFNACVRRQAVEAQVFGGSMSGRSRRRDRPSSRPSLRSPEPAPARARAGGASGAYSGDWWRP